MSFHVAFVLLLLAVLSHRAHSTCVQYQSCDDIEETLKEIASDPQNIQQLEKLFYPVNGPNLHSYAIIVYFLNYTGPLPHQCNAGSYPWDSYPAINTSYQEMEWYLWTTQLINAIAPPLKLLELGLYLPTEMFRFFFNRTSPFTLPTPTACLALPYRETPSRKMITIELLSIISRERYTEQLLDEQNQGVFSDIMAQGIPEHDIRRDSRLIQLGIPELKLHSAYNGVQWICGFGALLVVCHYGQSWLWMLKTAAEKHRGWLAVFWATVNVCFVLNIYTILKVIAVSCIRGSVQDCWYGAIASFVLIVLSGIPIIVHFFKFKHYLPPPRMWQLCFTGKYFTLERFYFLLSSWIMFLTLIAIPAVHLPYAILLLSTNYILYGTALVAIYLLLPAAICLTAFIHTIDQMFCINREFKLTCKQGLQQVYHLVLATVAFIGMAAFAISIYFILLLSKNGQKTQSISTTVFSIFSSVFLTVAPWVIRIAVRKMQQILFHKWETIHEQPITTSPTQ